MADKEGLGVFGTLFAALCAIGIIFLIIHLVAPQLLTP